jgi:DNA-binding beta-propeller fold protein YncE
LAAPVAAATPLEDPPVYQLGWGSWGTQPAQFRSPQGAATDAAGNLYVADTGNDRVQVFNADGDFLRQWEVEAPLGIDISNDGLVYVARAYGLAVYSLMGAVIREWGGYGSFPGSVRDPYGIAVNGAGEIYVCDTGNRRVQKFTNDGTLAALWGSDGSSPGQFRSPRGIALDSKSNVYVADVLNSRIQKFDPDGGFITAWSTGLNRPIYLAIDEADNVYVTDAYLNRCLKFTSDGTPILAWGSPGTGPGEFGSPTGIALDGLGHVFVVEGTAAGGHARIQRFGLVVTATAPSTWGSLKAKYR